MLKIFGCCAIIMACTAFGVEHGNEVSKHRKALEELHKIFTLFQLEVQFTKIPVREVFIKLLSKADPPYKSWMEDIDHIGNFEEDWSKLIDTHFQESHLTKEEKNELKALGKNLGCSEAISLYLSSLELSIQNTREEEKEKKKLYQSMGVMGGIFLVILLL